MTVKQANIALVLLDVLCACSFYVLVCDHSAMMDSIDIKADKVLLDTGLYYLFLATLSPLIRVIQLTAMLRIKDKRQQEKCG
jgi:hypothetical protein